MAPETAGTSSKMLPFIRDFSKPGELACDPFAGLGTTLVAAAQTQRRGLGFEIDQRRVLLARERLESHRSQEVREGTALTLNQPVDLGLSSVPYFGCSFENRAVREDNLYSAETYGAYLDQLDELVRSLERRLQNGRFLIFMAQNIRLPNGTFVPQAWDIARVLSRRLTLCEERVIVYSKPHAHAGGFPVHTNRSHEYALIARKHAAGIDLASARALLAEIVSRGFRLVVFGSLARVFSGETVEAHDVDFLMPAVDSEVGGLLGFLKSREFELRCWEDPLDIPVALSDFHGRYYFRAQRMDRSGARLQIDVNFESDVLPFEEAWPRSHATAEGIRYLVL